MLIRRIITLIKNCSKILKFLISNSKVVINLNIILKTINAAINETLSILIYKNSAKVDKQLLYTTIKKNAHLLDKYMQFPIHDKKQKLLDLNYIKLKNSLQQWNKNHYGKNDPIIWATRILEDYETFYPEKCPDCRFMNTETNVFSSIDTEKLLFLMKKRRSRRFYSSTPLNKKEKDLLIEAAIYAPSSCNRQSIRFIFIEEPNLKKFVSECVPGGREFFNLAPTIIIALADKRDYRYPDGRVTPYQDTAAAIQNLLLIAETMDLACCWASLTSYEDIINEAKFRNLLNIPEFLLITGSVAIGHKSKEVANIPRDNPRNKYSIDKFYWSNNK
ncbi:MAG: nitroreductase family protein [Candidatus Hodarchaeota archaeon]